MRRTFGTDTEAIFGAIIVVLFALAAIFILMTSGCSNPVALNPPEPVELSLTVGHSGILLFWTESSADDFIRYDVYCSEVSGELGISIGSNFEREDCSRYCFDREAGTRYFWTVVVVSEGGETPSNVIEHVFPGGRLDEISR